ncbi:hypothetical protein [Micromonospora sp. NPDC047134]|uniref:hypothetical protein n=1 Tax=Micromonospora sp. NPDC047134 TaxID=3154340 RepID=UPI0033EDABA0
MTEEFASEAPPDPTTAAGAPVVPSSVEPPSSLDLWVRAQQLYRWSGEDDGEPHILRGFD